MILRMPVYCSNFKCTADKCSDNCCIGWEIDIDKESEEFYRNTEGEFGKRLRESISSGNPACFKLESSERCPFLNESNLCDIYINLGEDRLCRICTEHPRYYEWFDGIKEGGTGMSCEESARLILTQRGSFEYYETVIPDEECEEYDTELFACMEKARTKIISHLQNRGVPFDIRMSDVLSYAEELQYRTDNGDYNEFDIITDPDVRRADISRLISLFSSLEMLDKNRKSYLENSLKMHGQIKNYSDSFITECPESELYLENAAVYFIWRHFMKGVFDEEFYSKVFLMAAGCALIEYLALCSYISSGKIDEKEYIRIAKEYSKEVEYSEANLETVMDAAYESGYFV